MSADEQLTLKVEHPLRIWDAGLPTPAVYAEVQGRQYLFVLVDGIVNYRSRVGMGKWGASYRIPRTTRQPFDEATLENFVRWFLEPKVRP